MKLFCRLVLTVAAAVAVVGCSGSPTPAQPSGSTPASAAVPSPGPLPPTGPRIVSTALPRETMPVRVLAISGDHVLVQGEVSQQASAYRISHDGGRTWVEAAFPCANPDGCSTVPPRGDRVGRPVEGVVVAYSAAAGRLDAYSLSANAAAGSSYALPRAASVYDLAGGLALLADSLTGTFTVHSLLDGTDRVVAVPDGSAAVRLFDDGSVLASTTGAGTRWVRISADGSVAPVFTAASGTGDVLVNGAVVWFQIGRAQRPPQYCAVDTTTATRSCRDAVTRFDRLYAVGSTGLLVAGYTGKAVQFTWLAYAEGTVAKPARLDVARAWDPGWPTSAEDAAPLLSVRGATETSLARPGAAGPRKGKLDWAIRAVLPNGLALGSDAVLGRFESHSRLLSWTRSLSATAIGGERRLGGNGEVAASGTRWALWSNGIRIYAEGRLVRTMHAPEQGSGLTFAGGHLLVRPACKDSPPQVDDDCDRSATLYDTATGTRLDVPDGTEDAHDTVLVYRGEDHSVRSTRLTVVDLVDPSIAAIEVALPDPGTDGFYTDVRIVGDWIGATQHRPDGVVHPVLLDYRSGAVLVGADDARLLALGDRIAVSVLAHSTTLQVWEFTTGAIQMLTASSRVVAVDGRRVAYAADGELVVAEFPG